MSSSVITITLTGHASLRAKLERAASRIARPTELMQAIAAQLEANVQRRFDSKTAPDGARWLPLAPGTTKRYAKQDKGSKQGSLLIRSGALRDSLSAQAFEHTAEVGFSRNVHGWPLGLLHEFGTQTMPRRQLLTDDPVSGTLGREDAEDIEALLDDFLADLID